MNADIHSIAESLKVIAGAMSRVATSLLMISIALGLVAGKVLASPVIRRRD